TAQIGINVVGIEPDCLVIVGHRLVVVVLLSENIAAAHEEVGLFRIKSDRVIAVPYRLVVFALGVVGKTAIVEGNGIVGLQLDGFIVVLDRLVVSAQAEKNVSPVVECSGILGIESERLVVILRRGVVIALVDICVAPNDVGDGQISGLVFPRGDRGSASGDRRITFCFETYRQILCRRGSLTSEGSAEYNCHAQSEGELHRPKGRAAQDPPYRSPHASSLRGRRSYCL